jgi:transcriptional regulator with XRE-family HTH domain
VVDPVTGGGAPSRPTVLALELGRELRRLRGRAGLDPAAAGAAIGVPAEVVEQVERGSAELPDAHLLDLLARYGLTDPEQYRDHLAVAAKARRLGWWEPHGRLLPAVYTDYLRLERSASLVRTYGDRFVPRLLQSREYARAVIALDLDDPRTLPERVELRMRRQAEALAPGGPTIWAIVSDAALRRPPVDPSAHREQLRHLLELQERRAIVLQVLPAASSDGLTAAGSFTLLRFAERFLDDVVYLQQTTSSLRLDRRPDVEHYTLLLDRLTARAEQPRRTTAILCGLLEESGLG